MVDHERVPSQAGVRIVNKFSNYIKIPQLFQTALISATFYGTAEFMSHRWQDWASPWRHGFAPSSSSDRSSGFSDLFCQITRFLSHPRYNLTHLKMPLA